MLFQKAVVIKIYECSLSFNKLSVNIYLASGSMNIWNWDWDTQVAKTILRLVQELEITMHSSLKLFLAVRISTQK